MEKYFVYGEILPELRRANLRSPQQRKASRTLSLNYSSVSSVLTSVHFGSNCSL
jgi:hypothetical protein